MASSTTEGIVLYTYWRSSSAYRVRIALAVKGLAYESRPVNLLAKEQRADAHLARSPTGFVPCLELEGRRFVESVAILELLEELYPKPALYPASPWDRAKVRALVEIINSGTQPLQNLSVLEHLSPDAGPRKAWAQHFIARGLKNFERALEGYAREGVTGHFAYGDTLSAADAFLVPQIYNARRFEVDLTPFPRTRGAAEAALATAAVQAALPENQPDAQR